MGEAQAEGGDGVGIIAARHGFSEGAARTALESLRRSGGGMAQFDHPELGGMGQWTRGGMLMIGDMFNDALKARVGRLLEDLAASAAAPGAGAPRAAEGSSQAQTGAGDGAWWPAGLGRPSASGAQNGMRYAVFPDARRLAVERAGRVSLRDTGDHRIAGVSQAQGPASTLRFESQHGPVALEELPEAASPD